MNPVQLLVCFHQYLEQLMFQIYLQRKIYLQRIHSCVEWLDIFFCSYFYSSTYISAPILCAAFLSFLVAIFKLMARKHSISNGSAISKPNLDILSRNFFCILTEFSSLKLYSRLRFADSRLTIWSRNDDSFHGFIRQ